jgi:hypothetical protein
MSLMQQIKTAGACLFKRNWYGLRRSILWPEGDYKRGMLKRLQKRYGCSYLIETGTFLGKTPKALSSFFKQIYTIELDPQLYAAAKKQLEPYKNVTCLQGDSMHLIPSIIKKLDATSLFWLDGHYSGEGTAKGEIAAPILQELEAIRKSDIKEHVIAIDDISDFCETDGNVSLSKVVAAIEKINPKYKIYFDYDILFALPSEAHHREFWRTIAYPFVVR